jgi:hypothetical protein
VETRWLGKEIACGLATELTPRASSPQRAAAPAQRLLRSFTVKLIIFISLNVFGAIGWWLGEPYGIMTAFLLSGVGSVVGVYLGWRAARRLLD